VEGCEEVHFNLAVPASAAFAPVILASALGYDKAEGLSLKFRVLNSPWESISQVGRGQADMTYVNSWFGFGLRDRGLPVKAFYSLARSCVRYFAAVSGKGINSIHDLRGKTVAADVPDLLVLAKAVLADEGLDPEDVSFVPHALSFPGHPLTEAELESIHAGNFDALWIMDIDQPILEEQGLCLERIPSRTIDNLMPGESLYTNENLAANRPHVIVGVGRALAKATVFSLTNPEAAVKVFWDATRNESGSGVGITRIEDENMRLRYDLASLKHRLNNMKPDVGQVKKWGGIGSSEAQAWIEFLRKNRVISSHANGLDYFVDFADDYSSFDADEVIQEAREWSR